MEGLKQRILGAFVLISLAVIFIPMLFDEPHEETQAMLIPIPERPPLPSVHIEEPRPVPGLEGYSAFEAEVPSSRSEAEQIPAQAAQQAAAPVAVVKPSPESAAPAQISESRPKTQSVTKTSPAPAKAERNAAGGWILQVGTFKSHDNAKGLRDRLQAQGLNAYVREIGEGEGRLMRVFIGPLASGEESQSIKSRIDKEFGVDALILRPNS